MNLSISTEQVSRLLNRADKAGVVYSFVRGGPRGDVFDYFELLLRPEGGGPTELTLILEPNGRWRAEITGIPTPWIEESTDAQ